jgi:tRNASer (uridine44-2'-O)-methyltransferase
MKERHKHLDSRVLKGGGGNKLLDVKRHVWKVCDQIPNLNSPTRNVRIDITFSLCNLVKDVAVATFLMLLWKDMYPPRREDEVDINGRDAEESWRTWGRPKGGFVDLGCVST